jgi:predicted outer membrane repeat protein
MESILPAVSCQFETSDAAAGSALSFTGGFLTSNRVQYTLTERNKYGLGGAIYVSNNTYTLSGLAFNNNSAFLGGALFASSDFSSGSSLSSLSYNANNALLGEDTPPPPAPARPPLPLQDCLFRFVTCRSKLKVPPFPFLYPVSTTRAASQGFGHAGERSSPSLPFPISMDACLNICCRKDRCHLEQSGSGSPLPSHGDCHSPSSEST